METKNIDILIARTLSGEASADERQELERWIAEDKSHREEYQRIQAYWQANVNSKIPISAEESWNKLKHKLQEQTTVYPIVQKKSLSKWTYLSIAASVAVLVVLSTFFLLNKSTHIEYYTLQAQETRRNFTLDDGTKITLDKGSRLVYSNEYGKELRDVQLKGQAYFEVTKDAEHPFEVKMGDTKIRVLGTVFTAKNDSMAKQVTASLLEGSIRFDTPTEKILLKPNEQLVYNTSTKKTHTCEVNAEDEAAWRNGLSKYRSVSLTTLITDLEQEYHVQIQLSERLKDPSMVVTATFGENQTLTDIFEVINRTIPIQWTKSGNIYIVQ